MDVTATAEIHTVSIFERPKEKIRRCQGNKNVYSLSCTFGIGSSATQNRFRKGRQKHNKIE